MDAAAEMILSICKNVQSIMTVTHIRTEKSVKHKNVNHCLHDWLHSDALTKMQDFSTDQISWFYPVNFTLKLT